MGNWSVDLEDLIGDFPLKLKQAMYAAAMKGPIARGTWDHCALNAAGSEIKSLINVDSYDRAASSFGITRAQAALFVRLWDSRECEEGCDEYIENCPHATEWLKDCILKAGLFSEPGSKLPKIIRKKVYEGAESETKKEFERLMFENAIPDIDLAVELLTLPPQELANA